MDKTINNKTPGKQLNRVAYVLFILFIIIGTALRLYIYAANRNLIIDEANVARNIYERGFIALLSPLDYEQYAPPLFLWPVKLFSLLFGFSEYALRLYPLVSSIIAILLLARLLRKTLPVTAAWYPLSLFAVGYLFLRYSSELKQYMPDVAVVLALLLLATSTNIRQAKPRDFILKMTLAGSIALWASMPAVFILFSIGCYYFFICMRQCNYSKLYLILLPASIWIVQFALYYYFILMPQANSDYLQNFHGEYFIIPKLDVASWQHNWELVKHILSFTGGKTAIGFYTNLLFIIIALVSLLRKQAELFILLIVPILTLLIAAALRQYSLLDRLVLFISPVILLLVGLGLKFILDITSHIIVRGVIYLLCMISFVSYADTTLNYPYQYEEVSAGLAHMQKQNISPGNLYIYHSSDAPFIYYTTIHPKGKQQWGYYSTAHILKWNTDYDSLANNLSVHTPQRYGFICTNISMADFDRRNNLISNHLQVTDSIRLPYIRSYIYTNNQE